MKKIIFAIATVTFLSGCATQSFQMAGGNNSTTPDEERMQTFFISGLGQTQEMDAAAVCGGDKVAKVEAHLNFVNAILGGVTWGIYTPRQAKVYCTQ